jgi:AraC family transcriptional regulator
VTDVPLNGRANLCFFPDGLHAEGAITVGGATECVSIFMDPVNVPAQLRQALRQPIVAFGHEALSRAFHELVSEVVAPDETFPFYSLGWILQALAYVARVAASPRSSARTTGLAPWQLRKAQNAMRGDLGHPPTVRDVAEMCGLSAGHFSRAFKSSTGLAPHQWLTIERVKQAQAMMLASDARLVDIAGECGFADQSHFTRRFVRCVGISPGAWLRQQSQ